MPGHVHILQLPQANARSSAAAAQSESEDGPAGAAASTEKGAAEAGKNQQGCPPSPQIEKPIEVGAICMAAYEFELWLAFLRPSM